MSTHKKTGPGFQGPTHKWAAVLSDNLKLLPRMPVLLLYEPWISCQAFIRKLNANSGIFLWLLVRQCICSPLNERKHRWKCD